MKRFLTILILLYSAPVTPGQRPIEWWEMLGAPCTTKTDILENTCNIEVRTKPKWPKKNK